MPPRERQKLEQRNPSALENVSDRYYRAGNLEGMGRINQELQDRLQNMPTLPMEGGSSGDNTGVMSFNDPGLNQMKNDYFGHRLVNTGWGQGLLNRWARLYGDEKDLEGLPDLGDKSGWLNADWDFDIGKNKFGAKATWNTPWWLGGYSG